MAKRFLTPIDLTGLELRNFRVQNLASAPSSPTEGRTYFDTTTKALRFYDGTEWVDVVSQDGLITQVNVEEPITSTGGSSPTIGIDEATTSLKGAMSAADKTKLDGVAAGATANDSDANLRDRATHTGVQAISTVDGLQGALDGKEDDGAAAAAVSAHEGSATPVHTIAQVTGLQTALDGKLEEADVTKTLIDGLSVDAGTVGGASAAQLRDRATHTGSQAISTVTGLQGALDGKLEEADVTKALIDGLGVDAAALQGEDGTYYLARANHSGTQAISTVSGLQGALDDKLETSLKGANNGLAELDSGGKVPTTQLPALAITSTYVVADITARDALTVQEGDVAIVQDKGDGEPASYIYDGTVWQKLLTPTDGVTAVTGGTGITSSGGDTPEISLTPGGVGTTELGDDQVTEPKLHPDVRTKLNAPTGAMKHAQDVGDGSAVSFVVTHNFDTRDCAVTVRETTSPYRQIEADVEYTGVNTVTVRFAEAPSTDEFRVIVVG